MREGSQHGNIASHCYKYQSGPLRNCVSLAWPKAPFVFKSWFCFMDSVQVFNFRWRWSGNLVVIVTKHEDFPQKVTSTSVVYSNPTIVHVCISLVAINQLKKVFLKGLEIPFFIMWLLDFLCVFMQEWRPSTTLSSFLNWTIVSHANLQGLCTQQSWKMLQIKDLS